MISKAQVMALAAGDAWVEKVKAASVPFQGIAVLPIGGSIECLGRHSACSPRMRQVPTRSTAQFQ
jgi:hypothetical protein